MAEVLYAYWEKYIKNRELYRLYSSEFEKELASSGLDPQKDPYKNQIEHLKKILDLLTWLNENEQEQGKDWGKFEVVDTKNIVRVRLNNMERDFADFLPNLKEMEKQRDTFIKDGNALMETMRMIVDDLLARKPRLPSYLSIEDLQSIRKWCEVRTTYEVKILSVHGAHPSFEDAFFLPHAGDDAEEYPSPFGTFDHFRRVVDVKGLDPYKKWLEADPHSEFTNEDMFTLRVSTPIEPEELHF